MTQGETLPSADTVLAFWFGEARSDAEAAKRQHDLWFQKSSATDRMIAERFLPLLTALASGLAYEWAGQGARQRLAAIIVLDQFSRNIFRGDKLSFAHDRMALGLTKDGLMRGEDKGLSEIEKVFFYLPLEHSERMADQDLSVDLYAKLAAGGEADFKAMLDSTLDYAKRHRAIIQKFGRFPHRNEILQRRSTPEEVEFLTKPGSGF